MSSLSVLSISRTLQRSNLPLLSTTSFQRLFNIKNHNTAYKTLQKLVKQKILERITNGKYLVTDLQPTKFAIANFAHSPSYISLETALNYYGILPQFPFTITSITLKKSKTIHYHTKYQYSHLSPDLYWGFQALDSFIIANKEKALLDLIYLNSKGLRNINLKELDLSLINKKILKTYIKKIKTPQFKNFVKENNLC